MKESRNNACSFDQFNSIYNSTLPRVKIETPTKKGSSPGVRARVSVRVQQRIQAIGTAAAATPPPLAAHTNSSVRWAAPSEESSALQRAKQNGVLVALAFRFNNG